MLTIDRKLSSPTGQKQELAGTRAVAGQKRKRIAPESLKSPAELAMALFKENGFDMEADPALCMVPFEKTTDSMIDAYKLETIQAARAENLDELKRLHRNGVSLSCCNRFGESLMHLVCRRGSTDIVKFLVNDAEVPLFLKDDYGRTPLHDACWTATPNFDLVLFILQKAPELMSTKDVRGHIPLNYVRRGDWDQWREFLTDNRALLRPRNTAAALTTAIISASEDENDVE